MSVQETRVPTILPAASAAYSEPTPLTVDQVVARLGLSRRTVIRIFENEPGVLVLARPETRNKRRYRILRVPLRVFERVVKKLEVRA